MSYESNLKNLRLKTTLLPETFKQFGLNVEGVGFSGLEKDQMEILVELAALPGEKVHSSEDYITIKVNLYDEEGHLIAADESDIDVNKFSGYDTLKMFIMENSIVKRTSKIRLYATL